MAFKKGHVQSCRRCRIVLTEDLIKVTVPQSYYRNRHNISYACCSWPHAEADTAVNTTELLKTLVRQLSARRVQCSVFASMKDSRIKTVAIPRIRSRELRELLGQAAFWQEYLGIAVSEWMVWWHRLPSISSHEVRLLIAALPKSKISACKDIFRQAQLKLSAISIACFEYFPYSRYLRSGGCLMMTAGPDPYLIGAGSFGVQAHCLRPPENGSSYIQPDYQTLDTAAREIMQIISGHVGDNPLPVQIIIDDSAQHTHWLQITELLPAHFQVTICHVSEQAGFASTHAIAADLDSAGERVVFPIADKAGHGSYAYPLLTGLCIVVLSMSIYLYRLVSEQNQALQVQSDRYRVLTELIDQQQHTVAELQAQSVRRTDLLSSVRDIVLRKRQILRLLTVAEEALLPGIWLIKTEFQKFGLRITGHAFNNNLVVQYSEALRQSDDIHGVRIEQLVADEDTDNLYEFVIECHLRIEYQV